MNISDIKKKLKSLTSEVNELHPLLEQLWSHIPDIKFSEYTHGTHEMGADFILSRDDSVLSREQYIGVVVKAGSIRQDHADVIRQIDECAITRFINGGKKEINLTQIWVVCNGTISHGAQRKINKNYSTSSIEFIDINTLTDLVEKHLPEFSLDLSVVQNNYIQNVNTVIAAENSASSLLAGSSDNCFIKPSIKELIFNVYEPKASLKRVTLKEIDLWAFEKFPQVLIIQGEVGAGKSRLLRELAHELLDPSHVNKFYQLPILIDAKNFLDNFGFSAQKIALESRQKHGLPENQKFVLFIDGLDELEITAEVRINLIQQFYDEIYSDDLLKGVVSIRQASGYQNYFLTIPGIRIAEIRPLSVKQVMQLLGKICSGLDLSKRLERDLKSSAIFASLPHTPIAIILLGELLRENSQDLPSNLAELYSQYTELILGRWEIKKGLLSLKEYQVAVSFLKELSGYMLENSLPRIGYSESIEMLQEYINSRNINVSPAELIGKLTKRGAVLYVDSTANTIGFRHKSFAEFFLAKAIVEKSVFDVEEKFLNPYWITVLFFVVGLKRDCPKIIQDIFEQTNLEEGERAMRFINGGNILMAAYETPYAQIESSLWDLFSDVADWYLEISHGKSESRLTSLPKMHLLSIFRTISSDQYGYPQLQKALEGVFLRALTSDTTPEKKAIILFMNRIAYISSDGVANLDQLLDEIGIDLPLELHIAIDQDAKKLDVLTDAVRRHRKKFRKLVRQSPKLKHEVQELFDKPII